MLSSLSPTGKNLLRSAEHFSLLMTHKTASSVGGFLSSLPPSHRAGNWNAFIAWLIYSSSSLHCKEGKLPLAYEQSTVISELLLQRTSRKKGAWSEEEQKGSQLSKFSWRLSEKEAIAVFSSCFEIIKPHKKTLQWNWTLAKPQSSSQWGMVSTDFWGRKKRLPEQKHQLQSVSCTCTSKYQN